MAPGPGLGPKHPGGERNAHQLLHKMKRSHRSRQPLTVARHTHGATAAGSPNKNCQMQKKRGSPRSREPQTKEKRLLALFVLGAGRSDLRLPALSLHLTVNDAAGAGSTAHRASCCPVASRAHLREPSGPVEVAGMMPLLRGQPQQNGRQGSPMEEPTQTIGRSHPDSNLRDLSLLLLERQTEWFSCSLRG